METVYVASFDIGKKNFAFCIEKFEPVEFEHLEKFTEKGNYEKNGSATPKLQEILDIVSCTGEIVLYKNLDLTDGKKEKKGENDVNEYCIRMMEELDSLKRYFDKVNIVLVEQQMSFGKRMNLLAVKLAQCCMSYFLFRYGREKEIIEFPAFHKTQILGAPKIFSGKRYKAMEKPQRKKWAVEKALEILENRNEDNRVLNLEKVKKKDDLADTFLQLQAFKVLKYILNP